MHPKLRVAGLSIGSNAGLVAVELTLAWITGSLAVLADAFHSGVDLTGSLVALSGILLALRAADTNHGYGYSRYENAAAFVQMVLIAIIGVTVIEEAVRRLLEGFTVHITLLALIAVLATLVYDVFLFRYISRKGEVLGSSALEADAYHFATDAVGKVGVVFGIGMAYLGYPVMDVVGALIIAVVFLITAFRMGRKNLQVLVDASPPVDVLEEVRHAAENVSGVAEVHSLRARMSGRFVFVDLAVHVTPGATLESAHGIAHEVEKNVQRRVPAVAEVVVHVEPDRHEPALDDAHPA
ncbi:MAG TPA: cation transporter [Thermoplasmata archaeon]|nr:cation transporter [Thermoplasmata archaeon]